MVIGIPDKKVFIGVDFTKFIMSLFVVAIHVQLSSVVSGICRSFLDMLFSIAVPYFFIAFGYFIFRGGVKDPTSMIKKNLIRILKMYLIWTIIYLPIGIYGEWTYGTTVFRTILKFIRNFFLVGYNFYSWQLWFLLACVIDLIIFLVLYRFNISRYIFPVSIALYFVGIVMDYMYEYGNVNIILNLYYSIFRTTRNGIFYGMVYIAIGFVIAKEKKIIKWNYALIWVVLLIVTGSIVGDTYFAKILLLFISVAVFSMSMQFSSNISFTTSRTVRKTSTGIYLIHMIYVAMYRVGFVQQSDQYNYLLCFILTIFLSCITYCIFTHIKWKGCSISLMLMDF